MSAFSRGVAGRLLDSLRPSRRLELVAQLSAVECGLACLSMVLKLHGRAIGLRELRQDAGPMASGVTLAQVARAAARHGLLARAYRLEPEELADMAPGTILHWDMDHFVVLGRQRRGGIEIFDPRGAVFEISLVELSARFTGVAMAFEKMAAFESLGEGESPLAPHLRVVLQYRRELGAAIACSVLLQGLGLTVPLAIALAVEEIIPWGDLTQLHTVALAIVVAALAKMWASVVRGRILTALDVQLEVGMRSGFLYHLLHLPYDFHLSMAAGDVLARVNSQGRIRGAISGVALATVLDAGAAIVFFAALFAMSPTVATVVGFVALAHGAFIRATRSFRERLMTEFLTTDAVCQTRQIELINNVKSIKSMGREHAMLERWATPFVDVLGVQRKQGNFEAVVDAISPCVAMLVPAAVVGLAGAQVARGEMTLGAMFAVMALAPAFMTPVSSMIGAFEGLAQASSVAIRVNDVLEEETEIPNPGAPKIRIDTRGDVEFRQVSFAYNGGRQILDGINLHIKAGQTVALVGATGSGKSTLAKLLLGIHRPSSGSVCVDGVSLVDADLLDYRAQLGVVPQEVELLAASIRANIAFGADVSDAQIEAAGRAAMIHERIMIEPNGYYTPVAEGGSSLSGGERQRVALARALVNQPSLMVLDEATSALDVATERGIHRSLSRLAATQLVIAHRLSTVRDADLIVVMDAGRIVEQGAHDELLARAGMYADLVGGQVERAPRRPLAC